VTHETIDYARLGIGACEAFMEGPAAFEHFVRMILSIAAPLHAVQTGRHDRSLELLHSWTPLSETRH
jgi:hypothetical protein